MDDAHNHLHFPELADVIGEFDRWSDSEGIRFSVVNGTHPDDWPQVSQLAAAYPASILPAFGLHPWKVADRPDHWLDALESVVSTTTNASIGECGLDRWIKPHDIDDQRSVFIGHLDLATRLNVPITIHCIQAWGHLVDILRSHEAPARGFLVHSFAGSAETATILAQMGGYFSFSGHFLHPRKSAVRDVFRDVIPSDRILVETDAPSMPLPAPLIRHPIAATNHHPAPNHPANLGAVLDGLADLLTVPSDDAENLVERNFSRLFTPPE